jgi:hypothetical protein
MTRLEKKQMRQVVESEVDRMISDVEKEWEDIDPTSILTREAGNKDREILLLGDSLLGLPSKQFELEKLLKEELEKRKPGFSLLHFS